jgi:MoxR-like ATPase
MSGEEFIVCQELLTHIPVADPLLHYAAALILATHPDTRAHDKVTRFVSYGASPRGMQALIRGARAYCALSGRTAVSVEDIRRVAIPVLRHRVILNFEGEAEQVSSDQLIEDILQKIPAPGREAA